MPVTEDFTHIIQSDLRDFSPMLLEAGLTESGGGDPGSQSGPLGVLLSHVSTFAGLVPRLIADFEDLSRSGSEEVSVVVPRRARVSRRAGDFVGCNGKLYPTRFVATRSVVEKDPATLSWLLYISYHLEDMVERATGRLRKHVRCELQGRRDYTWALRKENDILRDLETALTEANGRLTRAQRRILEEGEFRIRPQPYPPRNCPDSPLFRALRLLAYELERPEVALSREFRGMVSDKAVASLPFLYQRWCGVKIVQTLRTMGWMSLADPLPALFLGGRIRFTKDLSETAPAEMTLWCEPHLTLQGRHPSGLYSLHKEASPDFVFITPGPHGPDAFVLDPTLSGDVTVRREKSRYLTDLAFDALQLVAGVPALHQPKRAWSVSPIRATCCELLDLEGRTGTIPMHPVDYSDGALRGWLEDIDSYAIGWMGFVMPGKNRE